MSEPRALSERTIADFGRQWTHYRDSEGWFGSVALLRDALGPALDLETVRGHRVAEIGSGAGRIVDMLLEAGAAHVTAIEPSDAFAVLEANLRHHGNKVECQRRRGEEIDPDGNFDFVFSIGVLHHIPDPDPVMRAAFRALRPGGSMAAWLYGREGNRLYLALALPLRTLTTHLPDRALRGLSWFLTYALNAYVWACRFLPLPLRGYMLEVIRNLTTEKRQLVVYDQLSPAYAKYYRHREARGLLERAGFTDVVTYHRHGYSWTVVGRKPWG